MGWFRRFSLGQKIGCSTVLLALLIPGSLWLTLLVMDATKNYCSECGIGWMAVGLTWLAFPTIFLGGFIFLLSTLNKKRD